MDYLTLDDLRGLLEACEGERVSIVMPTHGAAPDNRQDPLQFKALLREAETTLVHGGMKVSEAAALLSEARDFAEDGLVWRPRPGGLAVFICDEGTRVFRTPVALDPAVSVGDRFLVRPLLAAADRGERFFVLALSQHSVRLYRGTRETMTEVDLGDMPTDILDALRVDGFEEQLQSHSAAGAATAGGGRRAVIFHGSGAETGSTTRYVTEFVKRVSAGLKDLVHDREAPFVVAAVAELAAMYRDNDRHHNVTERFVAGNAESVRPDELHAQAWTIASQAFEAERRAGVDRFRELAGTAHVAVEPQDVVAAAAYGRVDTLLLSPDASVWGSFDEAAGTVVVSPQRANGDDDLVDFAAARTLANSGAVYSAPELDTPFAAVLRY